MSEFPEWIEWNVIGFSNISKGTADDLHRDLAAVYRLVPDIDELMELRWIRERPELFAKWRRSPLAQWKARHQPESRSWRGWPRP